MRKVMLLAWREYKLAVQSKAFFVMIALVPVLMGGGLIVQKMVESQVDTRFKTIAVVDRTGQIGLAIVGAAEWHNEHEAYDPENGEQVGPTYEIELVPPNVGDPAAQRLSLSERVRERELHAFVDIGAAVISGDDPASSGVAYHSENAALDDVRNWITQPLNRQIRTLRLAEAGVDESTVQGVFNWVRAEPMGLITRDAASGEVAEAERASEGRAIGIPMVALMLMFLMIMVAVNPLINAVLEEKMQRIAEVMLGSVRPFQLMLGKLVGTLGVSLTVLAIYMSAGVLVTFQFDVADEIPWELLPWFLIYMVAAIFLFGALLTAAGAACSDLKEAQSLVMPVYLFIMLPMFCWLPVLKDPDGKFATVMSLIPPFTPILMLVRQAAPVSIPAWQPWVGLVGVALFTLLGVWVAGRILRVGLLMQGKPPSIKDLARWAIRG